MSAFVFLAVILVAETSFLFGYVAYREHRPLTIERDRFGNQTTDSRRRVAISRGVTRALLVLAIANGLYAAITVIEVAL